MSVALRPYPVYRQSHLRWLGCIPAHWGEKRTKYLFREVDERSATSQVVVTDHGREIARLVPTTSARLAALDDEDLVASGIIIPPEKKPSPDFWSLPRVPDPEGLVLKAVLKEREEEPV
ncbi:MAG: hypothetical protein M1296_05205 [Chloroflexi bacterium]|nr:hypothetical protein [Chloroflexota bacterium]